MSISAPQFSVGQKVRHVFRDSQVFQIWSVQNTKHHGYIYAVWPPPHPGEAGEWEYEGLLKSIDDESDSSSWVI